MAIRIFSPSSRDKIKKTRPEIGVGGLLKERRPWAKERLPGLAGDVLQEDTMCAIPSLDACCNYLAQSETKRSYQNPLCDSGLWSLKPVVPTLLERDLLDD